MMKTNRIARAAKSAISLSAVLVALTMTGCSTAGEERYEDSQRCSDHGAGYGSRHHGGCLYMQQHRRDREQLTNMERARINSEQARNNLEMLEIIRERRRHQ
ncbi:hypothetical protein [Neorhizobium galegae]|uniref:hypothetical protein n=1 Tax=Neorhizobium galegae TaxID=399 RepID=UPI0012855521|nr:hypothetical protein [Neorhizobium galegae]KAA9384046.1 hypothetical protein F4V88_27780 [Neorhizobium galegae]KAB1110146.1 hypothetical protein F4V89_25235 [Neorhizobium galegae]MCM2498687.1 hypothetical protein [Neorhizobium galegae]MCQ1774478.1 hypothetical protein [Neorhizobium galegae]MCQ1799790.1 hypothetical protein [Neorhizobium galegae]